MGKIYLIYYTHTLVAIEYNLPTVYVFTMHVYLLLLLLLLYYAYAYNYFSSILFVALLFRVYNKRPWRLCLSHDDDDYNDDRWLVRIIIYYMPIPLGCKRKEIRILSIIHKR